MSTIARVTVTLSAELVDGIDRLAEDRNRFIAEAVQHELARRRREDLLRISALFSAVGVNSRPI